MSRYEQVKIEFLAAPRNWLVTGAAGFIGSHLVEHLLKLNQKVVGLDNFATGRRQNLEEIRQATTAEQWHRFNFIQGDIQDLQLCHKACRGVDHVLHQAALGSVPRSIADPIRTHASNITGFLNLLVAARDNQVKRFVYASSSSVYGDHPDLPKREDAIGHQLSPYAVTKHVNELYAGVFASCYGIETIGLRYFNVFGPRQDPSGPYAAVIPIWVAAMLENRPVTIFGDGTTSRDFCYVANVVQANLLAATARRPDAVNQVYNIAVSARTSLAELFELIRHGLAGTFPRLQNFKPVYAAPRAGDIRHSHADISKAHERLGYEPGHTLEQGLSETLNWYLQSQQEHVR
jgi:UDP-N-acetylglucosamine 4-epimerase